MGLRFLVDGVLWVAVIAVGILAASRGRILLREGIREGTLDFLRILPRIFLGVVGSGYLAAVVPQALMTQALGPGSGFVGVAIATVAGALTPGGAVVGFSIGAAALKAGAGVPQIYAYAISWALMSLQRLVTFETPMMPPRVVMLRAAVSVPLPFIAAASAMLLNKP